VPSDDGSAGAVLHAHLRALREDLLVWDPQVRLGVGDSTHQMRVVTRRLRGALASFGPLLTGERVTDVRGELRWLAEVLGGARDAEVTCARMTELIASLPDELVAGGVGSRVATDCRRTRRTARSRLLRALGSRRYLLLLDSLDALVDEPPLTAAADGSAGTVLARLVRHDARRVARAWRAAWAAPAGPTRDERLHEARRAAKRVRYAAEAAGPATGRRVVKLAHAAKDLQTLLGDHHDSVEAREYLRRLRAQAESAGESGSAYEHLDALEHARADGIEAQLPAAWDRFRRRRRRLKRR
jgi:CHAD domain-containing protein